MATLNVCSRLGSSEIKRFQVTVKDLEQNVKTVIEEISKNVKMGEDGFGELN